MIKLYNDNCFKILEKTEDNSIDFILTDPPYGTTECKWDNILPFDIMWKHIKRITKKNSCIALFGTEPFSSHLRLSNLDWYKYDWIWQKSKATNYLNAKKQPLRDSEIISIFYNKQPKYFPQMEKGEPYNKGYGLRNTDVYSKQKPILVKNEDGLRYPKTIKYFKTAEAEGDVLHPTQKPVALLEYLIKTYTNKNDIVLDFTMGCGSAGIACKNTNRNFIGIEKDKKYFEIAKERINYSFI